MHKVKRLTFLCSQSFRICFSYFLDANIGTVSDVELYGRLRFPRSWRDTLQLWIIFRPRAPSKLQRWSNTSRMQDTPIRAAPTNYRRKDFLLDRAAGSSICSHKLRLRIRNISLFCSIFDVTRWQSGWFRESKFAQRENEQSCNRQYSMTSVFWLTSVEYIPVAKCDTFVLSSN